MLFEYDEREKPHLIVKQISPFCRNDNFEEVIILI